MQLNTWRKVSMADASFWSFTDAGGVSRALVPVLELGELYSYTIPSFSVLTVKMRRIKYQCLLPDGSTESVDGFIRDDPSLQRMYPAEVSVESGSDKACIVKISELEKSIDVSGLNVLEDRAFIIWQWEWSDRESSDSDEESRTDIPVSPQTPPTESDSDQDDEDALAEAAAMLTITATPMVTHTVTFKCIGSTKEYRYQETLARCAQIRNSGEEVSCTIEPEPSNPFDSDAIAFKAKVDGSWKVIGYVVKEALKETHEAFANKQLTKVAISWVKYVIYWRIPGWYAGINVTRIGEWSQTIVQSQSARM